MNESSAQEHDQSSRLLVLELVVVFAACAFFLFYGIGSFGLLGADEPRYAQVAREMLGRHDWITPVLNGVPWLEKPVLFYWGAMLSYKVLGVSDWAARVPVATLATCMVVAAYIFVSRFRPGVQLQAALIVVSSVGVIGFGRAASTDMPLTATFTIAMLAWFWWTECSSRVALALFWIFIGLATLAKGPVAPFLAAALVVSFSMLHRDRGVAVRTVWSPTIALFFLVALPWYVLVQLRNPQFFSEFIIHQNLARYSSNLYRHPQPFWYYIPVTFAGLLPWVVLTLMAAAKSLSRVRDSESRLDSFLLIWGMLPVVFFSFSQSKLPGYILPAIPPLCLLCSSWLWRAVRQKLALRIGITSAHSMVASVMGGGVLLVHFWLLKLHPPPAAWLIAGLASAIVFMLLLIAVRLRGVLVFSVATLVPVIISLSFVVKTASRVIDRRLSARPVAEEISNIAGAPTAVAAFGVTRETEYGLNFYRNAAIQRYERGEVPAGEHLLVLKEGREGDLARFIASRHVLPAGRFAPQKLEFFRIAPATDSRQ